MLHKMLYEYVLFLQRKNNKLIGKDENGNFYYQSNQGKRWVIYNKKSSLAKTTVPPRWHIWLHYTDNEVPTSNKEIKRTPNLTNIKNSHHQNKKIKSFYKSWNPNS
ncbi:MAG: complex I NDUFA12 subunit family protein [Wolbachia endosymbiont of Menacanthus eurysternus]|nr:MAG: complex I NDUFA12 subunit family protein [Wolbachia endosymbiont of Menacanthus eurysternus]